MEKYRTYLLVGAPGSGKGTQGKALGLLPGFFHCACGDVFRSIDTSTTLGQSFLKYSSRGQLVPDEITVQLWRARIKDSVESHAFRPKFDRLVLDGIPRNVEQARLLEDILEVERIFHLVCPDQERLVDRLKKRALRDNRLDDANEDVISHRLEVYRAESEPLISYYPPELVQWIDALAAPHRVMHQMLGAIVGHPAASEPHESDPDQERLLFHFLMENTPDRIYFKDAESRFLKASRAIARLFHVEETSAVIGKKDSDFFPEADAQRMFNDEQRIMKTGEPILDKVGRQNLPGGGTAWTLTTKMPLRDAGGRIIGTCGISKDITKIHDLEEALKHERDRLHEANENLKAAQAQIVEAEKAASVARLAFGVAHEIRNPLAILGMGLDCLSTSNGSEPDPVIEQMRDAVQRADGIINELMLLSTSEKTDRRATSLLMVLDQALEGVAGEAAAAGIQIAKDYEKELPPLRIDPVSVERAFSCLMQNAVHAMSNGGTLTLRAVSRELTEADVKFDPGSRSTARFRSGERITVVEVDDTGGGIPPNDLQKIYDPFFTSKPTGKGTGLGLTVARKLFESNDAALSLTNRPEGGVRATISFKR